MPLRLLVSGGRDYEDIAVVYAELDQLLEQNGELIIIEGGATGADRLARKWAEDRNQKFETYEADWNNLQTQPVVIRRNRFGKAYNAAAGFIRNKRMLCEGRPDMAIIFPGGKGTANMTHLANEANLPVVTIG